MASLALKSASIVAAGLAANKLYHRTVDYSNKRKAMVHSIAILALSGFVGYYGSIYLASAFGASLLHLSSRVIIGSIGSYLFTNILMDKQPWRKMAKHAVEASIQNAEKALNDTNKKWIGDRKVWVRAFKRNLETWIKYPDFLNHIPQSFRIENPTKIAIDVQRESKGTQFNVVSQNILDAAKQKANPYLSSKPPVVLSCADPELLCDNIESGEMLSEEAYMGAYTTLFATRCSLPTKRKKIDGQDVTCYGSAIPKHGALYSPDVRFDLDSDTKLSTKIAVISCREVYNEDFLMSPQQKYKDAKEIIRSTLRIAHQNGHRDIVIGPWGFCKNYETYAIAEFFRDLFREDEFKNVFRSVTVACNSNNPRQDQCFQAFWNQFGSR